MLFTVSNILSCSVRRQGTSVTKETEFRTAFFGEVYNLSDIKSVSNSFEKYCGEGVPPSWTDQIVDSGGY